MVKRSRILPECQESVQPPEKAGFQLALFPTLVNYSQIVLDLSDQRELVFKMTCARWGQLFRLPNIFNVKKGVPIWLTFLVRDTMSLIKTDLGLVCVLITDY